MGEQEIFYPNDTTRMLREILEHLEEWRTANEFCDQRHTAMVMTKIEEAELLSLRMVKP